MCVCVWEYTFRLKVIKNFFFVSLWMSNVKAQVEEFQSFLTGTNKINLSSLSKWQKIENWELQTKICFQIVFNQTSFGIVDVFPQEYGRELETDMNCICLLFLFIFFTTNYWFWLWEAEEHISWYSFIESFIILFKLIE